MRHVQGENRDQAVLLPERLDDFIAEDSAVRVIDAFVDRLNIVELDFTKAETKATGRKPYAPSDLLNLHIYGYLNQLRSSRKLERECQRNVELMWLMCRLAPDFKTIAEFRRQNGGAIGKACVHFMQFCRQAGVVRDHLIAIDGSKFRAAASKDQAYTDKQLKKATQAIQARIAKYLARLETADRQEAGSETDPEAIRETLKQLQDRKQRLDDLQTRMETAGQKQVCATEDTARIMRSGREGMVLGYNVQSAVDVAPGMIVHHDVTTDAADSRQLQPMAEKVQPDSGRETLEVAADAGYSNGEQLAACKDKGIAAAVPPNRAKNNQGPFFQRADFTYDAQKDEFTCPAGQVLRRTTKSTESKHWLYSRSGCGTCPLQSQCTKADRRWVTRHFHEEAFDRTRERLKASPGLYKKRLAVARPFAQVKQQMGIRRFQCRGQTKVRGEMGLAVLAHNLKRLMGMLGNAETMELLAAST